MRLVLPSCFREPYSDGAGRLERRAQLLLVATTWLNQRAWRFVRRVRKFERGL